MLYLIAMSDFKSLGDWSSVLHCRCSCVLPKCSGFFAKSHVKIIFFFLKRPYLYYVAAARACLSHVVAMFCAKSRVQIVCFFLKRPYLYYIAAARACLSHGVAMMSMLRGGSGIL